jgi:carboxymethylenebutenolidase
MKLVNGWTKIETPAGMLPTYASRSAAPAAQGPLPGIIVIQEAWGVDDHIMDVADRLAAAGYHAVAPDLYARGGERKPALAAPRVAKAKQFMDGLPPAAIPQLMDPSKRGELFAALPAAERGPVAETLGSLFPLPALDSFLDLLLAVGRHLRQGPCQGRKVGSVGFCMGGGVSALLATADPELAAAVICYGPSPPAERAAAIRCPVLGLYAGEDPRINPGIAPFAEAMRAAGKRFESVSYAGARHAFFNDTRPAYHVDAARDGWARILGWFARELV